jgi:hypothetical protein
MSSRGSVTESDEYDRAMTLTLTDRVNTLSVLTEVMDYWCLKPGAALRIEDSVIDDSSQDTLKQSFAVEPPLQVQSDIEYLLACINDDCFMEELVGDDAKVKERLEKLGLKSETRFGEFLKRYRERAGLSADEKQAMRDLLSEELKEKEFNF